MSILCPHGVVFEGPGACFALTSHSVGTCDQVRHVEHNDLGDMLHHIVSIPPVLPLFPSLSLHSSLASSW